MTRQFRCVAAFGELVLRLSVPQGEAALQSHRFDAHVGGAEANVAVALSSLGHRSRVISALPEGAIADGVRDEMRRHGVDTTSIVRRAGRLGLYFLLPGGPMHPAEIIYDRAGSAFSAMAPDDWDWGELLSGTDWLHVSGVTPALGPGPAAATLAAVRAARSRGIGVSFDGNWRGKLWESWDADPQAVLRPIVDQADVFFGNHRDASLLIGRRFSGDGEDRRREAAEAMLQNFPALSLIASTARTIISPLEHQIVARVDDRAVGASTLPAIISPIVDRVGTGDAFAAGVLDGFWQGLDLPAIAARGLALSALKHGRRGDLAPFSAATIEQATTSTADIDR